MEDVERSPGERGLVAALLVALFVSGLDASVVNIMLPKLQSVLSVSMESATLLATVYVAIIAATSLPLGRCADLTSPIRVFTLGVFFFAVGSLMCGLFSSFSGILGGRAVQGLGAAMLAASFGAVIIRSIPPKRSGSIVGAAMAVMSVGSLVGPPLGGYFASELSWHWAFLLNVPLCAVALILLLPHWSRDDSSQFSLKGFDVAGSLWSAVVLLVLPAGLHLVSSDGWGSPKVWGCLLFSLLAAFIFFRTEQRATHPLLAFELFSTARVKGLTCVKLLLFIVLNGVLLVYPFFMTSRSNLHVGDAGWLMLASAVAMTIITPLGGKLCDKLGDDKVMLLGAILCGLVTLASLEISDQPSRWALVLSLAGYGTGVSLVLVSSTLSFLNQAPREHSGIFSAVNSMLAPLGGAMGMSIFPLLYGNSGFRGSLLGVLAFTVLMILSVLFLKRSSKEGP